MKKLFCALLVLFSVFTLAACGGEDEFKVGVILVGDETEGYSLAHINGIKAAAKKLDVPEENIVWKEMIHEDDTCATAANELVAAGCDVIFSNSYGHQDYIHTVASQNQDVQFVAVTGDYAALTGLDNYSNAFTYCFEARYVSGIVAGMKIKELVETEKLSADNFDANNNVKVGYVGAFPYAEVVSGYTAFYLGIKSVYENVVMDVQYTSSWFDLDKESQAAELLVNKGCVIIGQHADSTGAPSKVQSLLDGGKVCYSVGYNIDMIPTAKTAALTSATNNWAVYYEYAIGQAKKGEKIATNWAQGYMEDAVAITKLNTTCAEGTQTAVDNAIAAIKNGTLKVFNTNNFTVGGQKVTTVEIDPTYYDFSTATPTPIFTGDKFEAIVTENGISYFAESVKRSAPYFGLRIDGITELNNN